jgi:hypothetical protein
MSAVTPIVHAGKPLVHIDFRGCVPGTFAPVIREAQAYLAAQPRGTVLALTNVEDVRFDPATVAEMQRFVTAATPYLKANALVGITGMKAVVFNGIKPFYKVPVQLCPTEDTGKAWLVQQ